MVEPIEPVSRKKRKRVENPFLVVPVPFVWTGAIIPHALVAAFLASSSRVVEVSIENFDWQRRKHEEGKKDEAFRARVRQDHLRGVNKNLSNFSVVRIPRV